MKVGLTQRGFTLLGSVRRVKRQAAGFTLVETMIVLAVTAFLFLVAVDAVNGKQSQTEFQQAINDIQNALQQTIATVNSGDYVNEGNFSCSDPSPGTPGDKPLISSGRGVQEGSSTGCILLGKVVQFSPSPATDPQEYIAYLVAGLRQNNGDIVTAAPTAVAPNLTQTTLPDATVPAYLEGGLTVASMTYNAGGSPVPIGAMGLISGLGSYGAQGYSSGSQQVYLVPITGSTINEDTKSMASAINNNLAADYNMVTGASAPANYSIQICFNSGTTGKSGLITIGGAGGNNLDTVTTTIFSTKDCS